MVAIVRDGMEFDELTGHGEAEIVLDETPFYAEGGGQVGDRGVLREPGGGSELFTVTDTQKPVGGLIVHRGTLHGRLRVGETDRSDGRRRPPCRHDAQPHGHAPAPSRPPQRRGRARPPGRLARHPGIPPVRFPVRPGLTAEETRAIEDEVRRTIREDRPVTVAYMPMAEAIEAGADAFFDEKYGETVRTVRVEDYSFELCGGTHCRASGQIGGFVITGERSIGSGVRRIEALTGVGADAWQRQRSDLLEAAAEAVGARSVEADRETGSRPFRTSFASRSAGSRPAVAQASPKPGELAAAAVEVAPGMKLAAAAVAYPTMDALKAAARDLSGILGSGVVALGLDAEEPQLFVTVSDDLVARGISAGELVTAAMPAIDGRGGGRTGMAQGRGTRRDGLPDALAALRARLEHGT